MNSDRIPRRKLSHEVLNRLMSSLRAGEFPVGTTLPSERDLMQRFGVGRPAVREALQAMERMGFISIMHGEGAEVLPVSAATIIGQINDPAMHILSSSEDMLDHLKEARLFFECGMVERLASTAGDEDIERLGEVLRSGETLLDDQRSFHEHDMTFHRTIAKLSGNPIYAATSQAMLEWLGTFYATLVENPGAEAKIHDEHTAIFDRIVARDPSGASDAMKAHLTRANHSYHFE